MAAFAFLADLDKLRIRWVHLGFGAAILVLSFVCFGMSSKFPESRTGNQVSSSLALITGALQLTMAGFDRANMAPGVNFFNVLTCIMSASVTAAGDRPKDQPNANLTVFSILAIIAFVNMILLCSERCCCQRKSVLVVAHNPPATAQATATANTQVHVHMPSMQTMPISPYMGMPYQGQMGMPQVMTDGNMPGFVQPSVPPAYTEKTVPLYGT